MNGLKSSEMLHICFTSGVVYMFLECSGTLFTKGFKQNFRLNLYIIMYLYSKVKPNSGRGSLVNITSGQYNLCIL